MEEEAWTLDDMENSAHVRDFDKSLDPGLLLDTDSTGEHADSSSRYSYLKYICIGSQHTEHILHVIFIGAVADCLSCKKML